MITLISLLEDLHTHPEGQINLGSSVSFLKCQDCEKYFV